MSASQDPNSALETLKVLIETAISVISHGEAVVAQFTSNQPQTPIEGSEEIDRPELNALKVAGDCAAVIQAQATQLSLFIINEPFTPTAISKVLRGLLQSSLPGLVSTPQFCLPSRYTAVVRRDLAWRVGRLLKSLKELIQKIPTDGRALSEAQKNGSGDLGGERGSLGATGLLWAACDELVRIGKLGGAAHLVVKVEEYRDTLKDVLEELKEWGEETSDGDDDDDDDETYNADDADGITNEFSANTSSTQAIIDDLMNAQRHIPSDDPDKIRGRLDSCLRRLRLTTLLYQAVIKRRLKTLPSFPVQGESNICARLDEVLGILKKMPDGFGDVAAAFYELSPGEIDKHMDQRFFDAFTASELLMKPWGDEMKDAFTDWALKFQLEIKKTS